MPSSTRWTAAFLLFIPLPREGHCQAIGNLRVRAGASTITQGPLAGRARDTLFIESRGKAVGHVIEPEYLIERYEPKPATRIGAVVGVVAGTAAGLLIAKGPHQACKISDPFCGESVKAVTTMFIGTGLGAAAGALIGSLFKPLGWSRVMLVDIPEGKPRITPIIEHGRFALVIGLRW